MGRGSRAVLSEQELLLQPGHPAAEVLAQELDGAIRFDVASAFVSMAGVKLLVELPRAKKVRLICRAGHGSTNPHAVAMAEEDLGAEVRLVAGPAAARFHPKLYLIERQDQLVILTGSGNLTSGGLCENVEQFEKLSLPGFDRVGTEHKQRFNEIWEMGTALTDLRESGFWDEWMSHWKESESLRREIDELDEELDAAVPAQNEVAVDMSRGGDGWRKKDIYPLIARLIGEHAARVSGYVDRDRLAEALHSDPESEPHVEAASAHQHREPQRVAGNMVDWFSADFPSLPWEREFDRMRRPVRSRRSGRERDLWAYRPKGHVQ